MEGELGIDVERERVAVAEVHVKPCIGYEGRVALLFALHYLLVQLASNSSHELVHGLLR